MAGGPLNGLRVLDASQVMAGPYCSMLLADMGADVVKVEKPNGGDDARRLGPPFINGESAAFLGINRNKRSIGIDLKNPRGRELFSALADRADVVLENYRPGTMDALGLGYDTLSADRPELIYCSISGFGQSGPYRERGGFDLVAQGMSGLMSITGHPNQPPVKVGVPLCDLNAGMQAAFGILCAYINRLQTGSGQWVDVSLLEAGIAATMWESAIYFASGTVAQRLGSAHRMAAPYQALRASDGHLTIGAANQSNWEKLCSVLGRADLLDDDRFRDNPARTVNAAELAGELEQTLSQKTIASWLLLLEQAGIPAGPLNDIAAVYADPHVQARDMVVEIEHPIAGNLKHIGIPMKLSDTPGSIDRPAPILGQQTEVILREIGLTPEEIPTLYEEKIVV